MKDLFSEAELQRYRLRQWLYPSSLPKTVGEFIARPGNEALLTIEEVCAAFCQRGGFTFAT
jgi:hypothetical protein